MKMVRLVPSLNFVSVFIGWFSMLVPEFGFNLFKMGWGKSRRSGK